MKRWPGEPFEDYRTRRKGEDMVIRAHLNGRLPGGRYVDPALDRTMLNTVRRERNRKWFIIALKLMWPACFGYMIGTILYAILTGV